MGIEVRVDSKGRVSLPQELRDELGEAVIITRTSEGILIQPAEKKDFLARFREIITSEPIRSGTPENWVPKKMKAIWST